MGHEFFGTIFWVFLAGQVEVFGLGAAFQFGLSWEIVTSVFNGDFNAMTTMLKMMLGNGDPLNCAIRLVVQMVAGIVGTILLGYLDYDVSNGVASSLALANDGFSMDGLMNWVKLAIVLMIYFAAGARLKTGSAWLDTMLLLGVTFALGGADFIFAPNRVFFVGVGGVADVFASRFYWDYLAYAICSFVAKYLLDLYDGKDVAMSSFNFQLPEE